MTRCRCVSISASNAVSNSSLPGLCFAPSCSCIFAVISYMPSSTTDTYDVVGSRSACSSGPRQRQLRLRQLLEAAAEADEHQVGLVPEHLHERRRAGIRNRQRPHGLVGQPLHGRRRQARAAGPSGRGTSGAARSSLRAFQGRAGCAWPILYYRSVQRFMRSEGSEVLFTGHRVRLRFTNGCASRVDARTSAASQSRMSARSRRPSESPAASAAST